MRAKAFFKPLQLTESKVESELGTIYFKIINYDVRKAFFR